MQLEMKCRIFLTQEEFRSYDGASSLEIRLKPQPDSDPSDSDPT
jgi:hypothetical protein